MIKDIRYGSYSTSPSDYESPDGDLAAVINLIPEQHALSPILPPKTIFTLPTDANTPYKCWFLHEVLPQDNYIISHGTAVYWLPESLATGSVSSAMRPINNGESALDVGSAILDIKAVGNTLLILTAAGMHYVLWKGEANNYLYLGTHMPELSLSFGLQSEIVRSDIFHIPLPDNHINVFDVNNTGINEDYESTYTDTVLAETNKFVAENSTNAGKFIFPFFVRYAYRLYDGSLSMHSAPIFMTACSDVAPECLIMSDPAAMVSVSNAKDMRIAAYVSKLDFAVVSEPSLLSNWNDIISSVDIFISAPFYTYDQAGKCTNVIPRSDRALNFSVSKLSGASYYQKRYFIDDYNDAHNSNGTPESTWSVALPAKNRDSLLQSITSCAQFYFLKSYRVNELPSQSLTTRTLISIPDDYLPSLLTREVMTDDYDSHDTILASKAFNYNGRINLADVSKSLFSGFNAASLFQYGDGYMHTSRSESTNVGAVSTECYVAIRQGGKEIVVQGGSATLGGTVFSGDGTAVVNYFFYPNTNAYRAWVKSGNRWFLLPLVEHPTLNGAYFQSLAGPKATYTVPTVSTDTTVPLSNKIYTSEINNPFTFPVTGINTIGTGDIYGIASAAKALSQGQFGQFPLYAFSSEGVWALEVSATGAYSAKQPITRDVCINPGSITQIDTAVLYATDRGIMMLSGSNSICISDEINGQTEFDISTLAFNDILTEVAGAQATSMLNAITYVPFLDYIKVGGMIYDYVHQRILVYNPNHNYCYVYSLESKKWGMAMQTITDSIESYPEALAMSGSGVVDITGDGTAQSISSLLITRPIHLEPGDALKTIDTVIQRGYFRPYKRSVVSGAVTRTYTVKQILYGTRDYFNYLPISSSTDHYMRGFSGTPFKAFRLALILTLKKDESVTGCTVQYTPRFTNRPR